MCTCKIKTKLKKTGVAPPWPRQTPTVLTLLLLLLLCYCLAIYINIIHMTHLSPSYLILFYLRDAIKIDFILESDTLVRAGITKPFAKAFRLFPFCSDLFHYKIFQGQILHLYQFVPICTAVYKLVQEVSFFTKLSAARVRKLTKYTRD